MSFPRAIRDRSSEHYDSPSKSGLHGQNDLISLVWHQHGMSMRDASIGGKVFKHPPVTSRRDCAAERCLRQGGWSGRPGIKIAAASDGQRRLDRNLMAGSRECRLWHADAMLGSAVRQQPMDRSPPAETLAAAAKAAPNKWRSRPDRRAVDQRAIICDLDSIERRPGHGPRSAGPDAFRRPEGACGWRIRSPHHRLACPDRD